MKENLFSFIPKVDELLNDSNIKELLEEIPRKIVLDSIREEIEYLRNDIKLNKLFKKEEVKDRVQILPKLIEDNINRKNAMKLKRVINATGIIIHTNLGRSLISQEIVKNIQNVLTNYSNLEFDLEKGKRGERYSHIESIITRITGAESAMVVNNNAAAVMLVLSTIAKGKEVIVSRGELVEIGGSFRIPEVMEQSGAHLVDIGTTNKTHIEDYERSINENTGALLKVHTSNYRILGFTSSVSIEELYKLKQKYNIPLLEDIGSGVLIDLTKYGLSYEPTVLDSLKKGVDIVTFSGDKLLGGPQAGIIVGKKMYIDKMKSNPLTRAFRVDKFTIAALESTLKLYLDEEMAVNNIPTLNMISTSIDILENKAIDLYNKIKFEINKDEIDVSIVDDFSQVGGGSLPLEKLDTKCVVLSLKNLNVSQFEKELRNFKVPIIARIYKDNIYMDLRTIREGEYDLIVEGIKFALDKLKGVF